MRRSLVAGVVFLVACGGHTGAPSRGTGACPGTVLESLAPTPRSPFITGLLWLDPATLIVGVAGRVVDEASPDGSHHQVLDVDPHSSGMFVIDVVQQKIQRVFRGASFIDAQPRRGSQTELLVLDGNYTDHGWRNQVGVVDLASGCLRSSEAFAEGVVAIDPGTDSFVVSRGQDNGRKVNALERWEAKALRPDATRSLPRIDAMSYDPHTNLLVTTSFANDTIHLRDPVTLDERSAKTLPVRVRQGFSLIPGRGQIAMAFETPCTPTGSTVGEHVECREPVQEHGLLVVNLESLTELHRSQIAPELEGRLTWVPDGSRAFAPCANGHELCAWTPETGEVRRVQAGMTNVAAKLAFAADGDTYATEGAEGSLEIRSMATGALRWHVALH